MKIQINLKARSPKDNLLTSLRIAVVLLIGLTGARSAHAHNSAFVVTATILKHWTNWSNTFVSRHRRSSHVASRRVSPVPVSEVHVGSNEDRICHEFRPGGVAPTSGEPVVYTTRDLAFALIGQADLHGARVDHPPGNLTLCVSGAGRASPFGRANGMSNPTGKQVSVETAKSDLGNTVDALRKATEGLSAKATAYGGAQPGPRRYHDPQLPLAHRRGRRRAKIRRYGKAIGRASASPGACHHHGRRHQRCNPPRQRSISQ